jgi:hypothetical protein
LSFSCSLPFFIFLVIIATSTVVLYLVYIHSLHIDSSSQEPVRSISARTISFHDIGTSGTSTGITNSVRQNEATNGRADVLVEASSSLQLSSAKTINGKREGRDIMQPEQQSEPSLAESQFYARTSSTPSTKRHDLIFQESDEIYSSPPPIDDTFHDAIDDLNMTKDQIIDDKSKKFAFFLFYEERKKNERSFRVCHCRPLSHEFIHKSIN